MASDLLGTPFDIHGGGLDLKFPHHDNEIAQGCCYNKKKDKIESYAKYWMHNGFVTFGDKKMSKSIGNIILLNDYLKKYDGEVIRLALLSSHYRNPLMWSENLILQSKNTLDKFYQVLKELKNIKENDQVKKLPDELEEYFFDDFNLAKVFAYLNKIIKNKDNFINDENKNKIKRILLDVGGILGILKKNPDKWFNKEKNNNEKDTKLILALIEKRNLARMQKNFTLADNIRKKLIDMGVEIKDSHDGVKWNWMK